MTPKDYVYLSLIALTAIVFYWTGFYGGFSSTLRILRKDEEQPVDVPSSPSLSNETPLVSLDQANGPVSRGTRAVRPGRSGVKVGTKYPLQSVLFGRN